ncbi:hypothetical protein P4200_02340 [Pseudomonas aeruginosa]|nr:hypothetical protein [Pseudomonas aeruginosa]
MTALTTDRNTPLQDAEVIGVPVAANVQVFAGAIVVANATGFAVGGSTATGLTYLGRAEEYVDNRNGADGAKVVRVRRLERLQVGERRQRHPGAPDETRLHRGRPDRRRHGRHRNPLPAGRIIGVEPDGVWVE